MARIGLRLEDIEEPCVEVWPDNWDAVNVFRNMGTQWRFTMNGPIGLDYNALPLVYRMLAIPRKDWPGTFQNLRVLESEAIKVMNENHG